MKAYVLGAGVSKTVGYPLGVELFREIDKYVRQCGSLWNRFDYKKDWPRLCKWLRENKNSLIAEAYRSRQIEHLFTILDLASILRTDSLDAILHAGRKGPKAVVKAERVHERFARVTHSYQRYRQILLWALEAYLQHKHHYDRREANGSQWKYLRSFGHRLCQGDFVISFNYDSSLERVLLQQEKWSPRDGYGFEIVFQRSHFDQTRVTLAESAVSILHLHGAIGWYKRPALRDGYPLPRNGGAIPREPVTPAPLDTEVSLDPLFLRDLDVQAVDASLPTRPPQDPQILLHPSFFKDYELEGSSTLFTGLWRKAASVLRAADEIVIIGYSLPSADSASLTLLLTNCDRNKVKIVNSDRSANRRLRRLLAKDMSGPARSFQAWLAQVPEGGRIFRSSSRSS